MRLVESWVPMTAEAFKEYRQGSHTFSKTAMQVVRNLLSGEKVKRSDTSLSKREWNEMLLALHLDVSEEAQVA